MKLTAFQYGKTELAEAMIFENGSFDIKQPIALLFFLIETGDRKILVDVGCDTMPGFPLFEHKSPVEVLEEYVSRESITDVIITHAHHDHIEAVKYYKSADVYLHRDSVKHAEPYNIEKLRIFDGSFTLCEGVEVIEIGGHSFGSCIVRLDSLVLCGDECYSEKNLTDLIMTGSSVNRENSLAFLTEYRKPCYSPILFHSPSVVGFVGHRILFETDV
ncbi:MAG: MBL fold metallo-hydrolase [Clostridia bacterium]|nr:MBL fold metallo-hydrolase [Clostridia bacterium]